MLEKELRTEIDKRSVVSVKQAEFRKGTKVIKNVYVLKHLGKIRNKRLYTLFIDFKKGFDSLYVHRKVK